MLGLIGSKLDQAGRRKVRTSVWLTLAAAVLALGGIFGFGGLTGAGGYFSESAAERDAALAGYYWQIWGILLPIAVATVLSGIALSVLAGVLARFGAGWPARVAEVVRALILPATVLSSVPYWFGPELEGVALPGWVEPALGVAGVVAFATVIGLGVAMIGLPTPTWAGVALILGAAAALATLLPLFVFVGTLVAGVGLLRWDGATVPTPEEPRRRGAGATA